MAVLYRDLKKTHPTIVRGEGVYLHDAEGRRYLDAAGGAAVVTIGHGVKEVARGAKAGIAGDHVLLAPPYVIERHEIEIVVDTLGAALAEVDAELSHR